MDSSCNSDAPQTPQKEEAWDLLSPFVKTPSSAVDSDPPRRRHHFGTLGLIDDDVDDPVALFPVQDSEMSRLGGVSKEASAEVPDDDFERESTEIAHNGDSAIDETKEVDVSANGDYHEDVERVFSSCVPGGDTDGIQMASFLDLQQSLLDYGLTRQQVRKVLERDDADTEREGFLSFSQLKRRLVPILRQCDEVVASRTAKDFEESQKLNTEDFEFANDTIAALLMYNGVEPAEGFDEFDMDDDGVISLEELTAKNQELNCSLDEEQIAAWHREVSRRGGGSIGPQVWEQTLMAASAKNGLKSRGVSVDSDGNLGANLNERECTDEVRGEDLRRLLIGDEISDSPLIGDEALRGHLRSPRGGKRESIDSEEESEEQVKGKQIEAAPEPQMEGQMQDESRAEGVEEELIEEDVNNGTVASIGIDDSGYAKIGMEGSGNAEIDRVPPTSSSNASLSSQGRAVEPWSGPLIWSGRSPPKEKREEKAKYFQASEVGDEARVGAIGDGQSRQTGDGAHRGDSGGESLSRKSGDGESAGRGHDGNVLNTSKVASIQHEDPVTPLAAAEVVRDQEERRRGGEVGTTQAMAGGGRGGGGGEKGGVSKGGGVMVDGSGEEKGGMRERRGEEAGTAGTHGWEEKQDKDGKEREQGEREQRRSESESEHLVIDDGSEGCSVPVRNEAAHQALQGGSERVSKKEHKTPDSHYDGGSSKERQGDEAAQAMRRKEEEEERKRQQEEERKARLDKVETMRREEEERRSKEGKREEEVGCEALGRVGERERWEEGGRRETTREQDAAEVEERRRRGEEKEEHDDIYSEGELVVEEEEEEVVEEEEVNEEEESLREQRDCRVHVPRGEKREGIGETGERGERGEERREKRRVGGGRREEGGVRGDEARGRPPNKQPDHVDGGEVGVGRGASRRHDALEPVVSKGGRISDHDHHQHDHQDHHHHHQQQQHQQQQQQRQHDNQDGHQTDASKQSERGVQDPFGLEEEGGRAASRQSKKEVVWGPTDEKEMEPEDDLDGAAHAVSEACKVGILRTFQGDVAGLSDIYSFSLQRPTQALLGACGIVDVLCLLLRSAIQEILADDGSSGKRNRGAFERNERVANGVVAVLTNMALWEEGQRYCRECSSLRNTLSLVLLANSHPRAKHVRNDCGRLAFILDGFVPLVSLAEPRELATMPDLGPIAGKDKLHLDGSRARGRPMVYVSSEEGDKDLLQQLTGGMMQTGLRCWGSGAKSGEHDGFRTVLGQMTGAATLWAGGESDQGAARSGPLALRYGGAMEALCQRTSQSQCVVVMLTASYVRSYRCRLEAYYLLSHAYPIVLFIPGGEASIGCAGGDSLRTLSWASGHTQVQDLREQGIVQGEEWVIALRQKCEVEIKGDSLSSLYKVVKASNTIAERQRRLQHGSRKATPSRGAADTSTALDGSSSLLTKMLPPGSSLSASGMGELDGVGELNWLTGSYMSRTREEEKELGEKLFGWKAGDGSDMDRNGWSKGHLGAEKFEFGGFRRKWNAVKLTKGAAGAGAGAGPGGSAFLTTGDRFQPTMLLRKSKQDGASGAGDAVNGDVSAASARNVWDTSYSQSYNARAQPQRPQSAHGRVQTHSSTPVGEVGGASNARTANGALSRTGRSRYFPTPRYATWGADIAHAAPAPPDLPPRPQSAASARSTHPPPPQFSLSPQRNPASSSDRQQPLAPASRALSLSARHSSASGSVFNALHSQQPSGRGGGEAERRGVGSAGAGEGHRSNTLTPTSLTRTAPTPAGRERNGATAASGSLGPHGAQVGSVSRRSAQNLAQVQPQVRTQRSEAQSTSRPDMVRGGAGAGVGAYRSGSEAVTSGRFNAIVLPAAGGGSSTLARNPGEKKPNVGNTFASGGISGGITTIPKLNFAKIPGVTGHARPGGGQRVVPVAVKQG